jgi:hypothetical protein
LRVLTLSLKVSYCQFAGAAKLHAMSCLPVLHKQHLVLVIFITVVFHVEPVRLIMTLSIFIVVDVISLELEWLLLCGRPFSLLKSPNSFFVMLHTIIIIQVSVVYVNRVVLIGRAVNFTFELGLLVDLVLLFNQPILEYIALISLTFIHGVITKKSLTALVELEVKIKIHILLNNFSLFLDHISRRLLFRLVPPE